MSAADEIDVYGALESSLSIAGKHICITGTLWDSRHRVESIARRRGAICQSSVTKATDILVVGASPGATKVNKAIKNGIPVIDAPDFFDLLSWEVKHHV
jgi:DNA ligase (NAD+)